MTANAPTKLNEEQRIIQGWHDTAIKLMAHHSVPAFPENYSVWFEYVRGTNKGLKQVIDNNIVEKKPFAYEVNKHLYDFFIAKNNKEKILEEASTKIEQVMHSALKAMESSTGETKNYNAELDNFTREIEAGGDNLPPIVKKLLASTQELKAKGEQLQKKLNESKTEVEILKSNLQEASRQAQQDALTGLSNRKGFDDNLLRLMSEAKADNKHLCLLILDVDHFKKFNDNFGHLLGDQVLRIVAQTMRDMVKGKDYAARYGGEEFAIILPDTPVKGAEIVADTIRKAISAKELKRKDTGESYGTITISIGVSSFRPSYDKAEDMISRADKALYLSKKNGRNRVTVEDANG
jgi:diguanylate cyclase